MKRLFAAAATAFAMVVAPTAGVANAASIQLSLTVPVQCTVDVVGGSVVDNTIRLQVHRNCNTGHAIVLSGLHDPALGNVSVSYNDNGEVVAGDSYALSQSEAYYDQTDSVRIEATDANVDQMRHLANSLQLSVVVA